MKNLLEEAIAAHGGADHWNQFSKIQANIVTSGKLFDIKGFPQDTSVRQMTVWMHEQRASVFPFGRPDVRTDFTAARIALETTDGKILQERTGNPDQIHQHMTADQWDSLDRAYFNGYALWMYLTTPFFAGMPGFRTTEIASWIENGETWRGLRVVFPSHIASHSIVQHFYFGEDYLLRRQDYLIDVAGEFYAAQYMHDYINVQGFKFPSKRRAYKRGANGEPLTNELMISIDLSDFQLI